LQRGERGIFFAFERKKGKRYRDPADSILGSTHPREKKAEISRASAKGGRKKKTCIYRIYYEKEEHAPIFLRTEGEETRIFPLFEKEEVKKEGSSEKGKRRQG